MSKLILQVIAGAFAAAASYVQQEADALAEEGAAAAPARRAAAVAAKAPAPQAAVAKGGKKGKAAPPAPTVTFDELKEKLVSVMKDTSKEAAIACLSRFGCQKLGDLTENQYDEFGAYLDSVIDGTEDPLGADTGNTGDDELFS